MTRPYPPESLPPRFRYPQGFLDFISSREEQSLYPVWWIIDSGSPAGPSMLSHPEAQAKKLVPFAKIDEFDDIACFDGNDSSGDPKVVMICSTPEREYGFHSFKDWLLAARKDLGRWSQ